MEGRYYVVYHYLCVYVYVGIICMHTYLHKLPACKHTYIYYICRNKGGMCIPNSTTDDLMINDVDLFQRSKVTA